MEAADNLFALRHVCCPAVAAATKGQEGHLHLSHAVHSVKTVFYQGEVVVALGKVLSVETAHGDGTDAYVQTVSDMLEECCIHGVAHLVVEHLALTQAAHVHLHTVAA